MARLRARPSPFAANLALSSLLPRAEWMGWFTPAQLGNLPLPAAVPCDPRRPAPPAAPPKPAPKPRGKPVAQTGPTLFDLEVPAPSRPARKAA